MVLEGAELRERVESRNVSWRELERAVEELFRAIEDFRRMPAVSASSWSELLSRSYQHVREEWERERELHECDITHIFIRDRV